MSASVMKWRVLCWIEDEAIEIQWADGSTEECPDHPQAEEWQSRITVECMDDCKAAGWELDEDENMYYDPVNFGNDDPPTRWRDAEELPEWWLMTLTKGE